MYKRLSILGSTGSIGTQALDVVRLNGLPFARSQPTAVSMCWRSRSGVSAVLLLPEKTPDLLLEM